MHAASAITFLGPLYISHLVKRNLILFCPRFLPPFLLAFEPSVSLVTKLYVQYLFSSFSHTVVKYMLIVVYFFSSGGISLCISI